VWTLDAVSAPGRALGAAAYLAAVTAFLLLQEVGLKLHREEHRAWWAGSGRDLLNVAGLLAIAGALRLLGLSGPEALLVGGTLTLLLFGASVFVATQTDVRHPRAWAVAAGLAFAVVVLLSSRRVVDLLGSAVRALFLAHGGLPR
jgi:hypothetical protein